MAGVAREGAMRECRYSCQWVTNRWYHAVLAVEVGSCTCTDHPPYVVGTGQAGGEGEVDVLEEEPVQVRGPPHMLVETAGEAREDLGDVCSGGGEWAIVIDLPEQQQGHAALALVRGDRAEGAVVADPRDEREVCGGHALVQGGRGVGGLAGLDGAPPLVGVQREGRGVAVVARALAPLPLQCGLGAQIDALVQQDSQHLGNGGDAIPDGRPGGGRKGLSSGGLEEGQNGHSGATRGSRTGHHVITEELHQAGAEPQTACLSMGRGDGGVRGRAWVGTALDLPHP